MDKSEFTRILSEKVELNPLYLACIDEVFETRYLKNGAQALPSFQENLERVVSKAKSHLKLHHPMGAYCYRGVLIADYLPVKDELIRELNQLIGQY